MITLFQFPAAFNVPNASPYCLKLETWLRLAGLEYQVKVVSDPRKAPKGKLPYVRIEGEAIGDSEIVIRTLGERYGVTLDAGLDARGKGWTRAITRLCDEHLYYLMLYFRWFDEDSWRVLKPVFFGSLPFGVRDAVAWAMRRKVRATLRAQGLGVHGRDELLAFARDDLDALDGLLGQVPYYGGEHPCSADAAAYGILANLIEATLDIPLSHVARGYPRLVAYCERMRERVWSE
ncbi:TPA: glutathione S-transferase C-terminal domain-containing protein [Pseudomonas aeruginosa]|nr:glutathione S-transferase C-terminal domain-containing protein [Pseudomonas aeruginosa]